MKLPDFLVIGAMKGGTTSLYEYLKRHPEIAMYDDKEPEFFTIEDEWSKGLDWYRSLGRGPGRIVGEASTGYTKFPVYPEAAARIARILPEAKLIYLVRNPAERIVSHKLHWLEYGQAPENPEQAFEHFIDCTRYAAQLERYLKHFHPSRVLVVSSEGLRRETERVLEQVFRFLGVDPHFRHPDFSVLYNQYDYRLLMHQARLLRAGQASGAGPILGPSAATERPQLSHEELKRIETELAPDTARLKQILGASTEPWNSTDEVVWVPRA